MNYVEVHSIYGVKLDIDSVNNSQITKTLRKFTALLSKIA